MQKRLTRLVLITCAALLGIIALQVFWLYKAYEEQKTQLLSLADNTLMETQIFTGVNAGMQKTAQSLMSNVLSDYTKGNFKDSGVVVVQKNYEISATDMFTDSADMKKKVLMLIGLDSSERKTYTLNSYKDELAKSLRVKKITMPFEMALVTRDGEIIQCTTDTTRFRKAGIKTNTSYSLPITLNKKLSGHAQLAFPHALFYLLRGMWVILLLSLCLIFICAFSFSYMVALFYREKRLADMKSDFMNNMTHELKTPISSVSIALELLQDNSVTMAQEARDEYFAIAGNELQRLTMLVDKVLRIAAFEKMEVKIRKEWVAIQEWVYQVVQSVKPITENKNVVIDIHVAPEDLLLYADRVHLTSILQNLLENAIKYADPNKSILHVDISITGDGTSCTLKVADNGRGIDPLYHGKVFDKFFRVPNGDEHDTKGYGLGLSYVKEMVRLHGGTVLLKSELKTGTTFIINLPNEQ